MTKESFDQAYVALDKINKLKAIKEKIKREFPEFEYNTESKEIGNALFGIIDDMLIKEQKKFDEL